MNYSVEIIGGILQFFEKEVCFKNCVKNCDIFKSKPLQLSFIKKRLILQYDRTVKNLLRYKIRFW